MKKWLLPPLLLLSLAIEAEQVSFKKQTIADKTRFQYAWKDHSHVLQQLNFELDNATIFNRFRHFKAYKPQRTQQALMMAFKKAAASLDRRKINVEFVQTHADIELKFTSTDQDLLTQTQQQFEQIKTTTYTEMLQKSYFNTLTDKLGKTGVKPDHVRIAQESEADIAPINNAILANNALLVGRDLAEYILAFVQSIPYNSLESRKSSNGAGFSPPLRLLNNNQGDCDSKVTLMATLLHALYPNLKIIIIYLPQHALIGIQMPHRNDDKYIHVEGRDFILAEPTGPAMMPFATIAESSAFFIDGQQYSYEMF